MKLAMFWPHPILCSVHVTNLKFSGFACEKTLKQRHYTYDLVFTKNNNNIIIIIIVIWSAFLILYTTY